MEMTNHGHTKDRDPTSETGGMKSEDLTGQHSPKQTEEAQLYGVTSSQNATKTERFADKVDSLNDTETNLHLNDSLRQDFIYSPPATFSPIDMKPVNTDEMNQDLIPIVARKATPVQHPHDLTSALAK